ASISTATATRTIRSCTGSSSIHRRIDPGIAGLQPGSDSSALRKTEESRAEKNRSQAGAWRSQGFAAIVAPHVVRAHSRCPALAASPEPRSPRPGPRREWRVGDAGAGAREGLPPLPRPVVPEEHREGPEEVG